MVPWYRNSVYFMPANRKCNRRAANHLKTRAEGVWYKIWIHIIYSKTSTLFKDLAKIMNKYKLGGSSTIAGWPPVLVLPSFFELLSVHGNWKLQKIKRFFNIALNITLIELNPLSNQYISVDSSGHGLLVVTEEVLDFDLFWCKIYLCSSQKGVGYEDVKVMRDIN